MCPKPGMMLRITATASLALPSAVSAVAARVQSHRSQRCASFGSRCPQYGHGILSPVLDSGLAAGASVYSTFISTIDGHNTRGIRQAKRTLPRAEGGPSQSQTSTAILETACPQAVRGLQIGSDLFLSLNPPLSLRICDDLRRWSAGFELRAHFLDLRGLLFYRRHQARNCVFQFRDSLLLLLKFIEVCLGLGTLGAPCSHLLPAGIDKHRA